MKYTNNRINSAENYAWYLDCKHSALGEINSSKICAFPIEAYRTFYFDHFGATMWPLAASGGLPLARGYLHSDSVNAQRMRPYNAEGPLARGAL